MKPSPATTTRRNPFRIKALEELAKHHEHRAKNYPAALEMTRRALALEASPALRNREERLMKRAAAPSPA